MNFSFVGRLFSKLSVKKTFIFSLVVLIVIAIVYIFNIYKTENQDTMLLVRTINNLQKDIKGIQVGQTNDDLENVRGKVDPQLINEFRDDQRFLNELVELKKEKMLHQLAIEVEGLRRQRKQANEAENSPPPLMPEIVEVFKEPEQPAIPVRPKIELAIANESNQSAVVTIDGGNPITLRVGNVVSNYRLVNVTRNYIQVEDLVLNTIESVYIQ